MAKLSPVRHARRALLWLLVLFVALCAILAGGNIFSHASWAPKLGLDLEGGTQMILAPKVTNNQKLSDDQLNQAVQIIRQRVDGSGVAEAEIRTQSSGNVIVNMPGIPDDRTRDLIRASANMQFRPVLAGGIGQGVAAVTPTGTSKVVIGADASPKQKPTDASDPAWITPELQAQFQALNCASQDDQNAVRDNSAPDRAIVACEPGTAGKYILGPQEIPGTDITNSSAGLISNSQGVSTGQWGVNLEFNGEGTKKFRDITTRGMQYASPGSTQPDPRNQFAIVLDGVVLSAPTMQAVITDGRSQISGSFTEQSAKALADQLKYGALPVSFDIQSENQISPTLGVDQLHAGLLAGVIGLILVAIYSFFQYRLLGLVTISSLVVAGVLTYLSIVILGWQENYRLTLAGVAGLIVAIGLTADSFIVYFERIRDELREGRGLVASVEVGWSRARRTILASKAVNLLGAVVLYFVAVGNVQGFAFTLGLTAIADLVVVFLFTHPVLQLLAKTKFFGEGHKLSGLDPRALATVPLYRGAGRVREPQSAGEKSADDASEDSTIGVLGTTLSTVMPPSRGKNAGAAKEAERRLSIAERRRQAALDESETSGNKGGK